MDSRVGIFITMNPGYAGRTELPESVKALFRPVVVIVPDLEQICEIMLFSEGFLLAKVLAKKMTVLYKLAQGQLSKQYHYDFGLRALKAVLVMAGELKRGSPDLHEVRLHYFHITHWAASHRTMHTPCILPHSLLYPSFAGHGADESLARHEPAQVCLRGCAPLPRPYWRSVPWVGLSPCKVPQLQ